MNHVHPFIVLIWIVHVWLKYCWKAITIYDIVILFAAPGYCLSVFAATKKKKKKVGQCVKSADSDQDLCSLFDRVCRA